MASAAADDILLAEIDGGGATAGGLPPLFLPEIHGLRLRIRENSYGRISVD
jgi:hypothetical protein